MRPDFSARVRADQVRAAEQVRRIANNPYTVRDEPERRTYSDPTADRAIANVDRARRWEQRG